MQPLEDLLRTWLHRYRAKRAGAASLTFRFRDYDIPLTLADLTGGGAGTWAEIAALHLSLYDRYCPVAPAHQILEIGCGIGRDAMVLADRLGPGGRYLGLDIIRDSIAWAQAHITTRDSRFRFVHVDIGSPLHNPKGSLSTPEIMLPASDGATDRVIAQSVFTHMFAADVGHYLKEIRRVLKPDGRACVTMFLLDGELRRGLDADATRKHLTFRIARDDGTWIDKAWKPESAVAFPQPLLESMLDAAGLSLDRPPVRGAWAGGTESGCGQDVVILRRS